MSWIVENYVTLLTSDDEVLAFDVVNAPHVQELGAQIEAVLGLEWDINFAVVKHAYGMGGLYHGDLMLVGARDMRELAETVMREMRWYQSHQQAAMKVFNPNIRFFRRRDVINAVWRFAIAHELAHAKLCERGDCSPGIDNEARADFWVGRLAEHFNWDTWLDRLIAAKLGCTDLVCTHPSPVGRVQAYSTGRKYERDLSIVEPRGW